LPQRGNRTGTCANDARADCRKANEGYQNVIHDFCNKEYDYHLEVKMGISQ
jgi:hypothetical protein